MFKKGLASTSAVFLAAVAMAAPASAMTATHGAYSQATGPLSCEGQVQGDGDGGTLYVEVSGSETRPADKHFRTYMVKTKLVAQEKNYAGEWVDVAATGNFAGKLGRAVSVGGVNVSPFRWGGDASPELSVKVTGFDDLFRAKVITKVYDDEGVRLTKLTTYEGSCRV
ncbi:hypothetical protein [Nocardioides mesophilus]|uniref:PLAT domain-containing protein n=1 Tax=Nocardioides mesophilus TaxID=433659 RepID=A0A7G9RA79_9ACTN|nr:hypothetical protein [Nocardioides mesophilus]QNN52504.1 hypothetical protein H9L09_18870 [Nocardioides mesophilus]